MTDIEKLAKGSIRHIILFKLYEEIDPKLEIKAIQLLQALGEGDGGILEWRVERSMDTRKGVVIIESGLFKDGQAYERFRKSKKHLETVNFMKQIADWTVGDYIESISSI